MNKSGRKNEHPSDTVANIAEAVRLCKRSFIGVAVFSAVANLMMLVPAFFMLNVYDKAVGNNSVSTLVVLSVFTAVMFCVLGLMEFSRSRVLVAITTRLDRLIAPELYQRIFLNAVAVGGSRATAQPLQDLTSLRQFLTGAGVFALFDAPWLPIYLLILFLFHPYLGWLGLLSAVTFLFIAISNQKLSHPKLVAANSVSAKASWETQKSLRNAEAIVAMGMLSNLESRWRVAEEEVLSLQESASHVAGAFNALTKTLRIAVQSAAIALGAYLVLAQEISPGMIIAGSILIGRALQPVEVAVGSWKGFVEAVTQIQRIDDVMSGVRIDASKMALPDVTGRISAQVAAIVPPGAKTATVRQATFEIQPGTTAAILGASGAGKSTLIRGILGIWPTASGEIRIDGAEASSYDRAILGPQVGYLPQDIELLQGTVSENICRFGNIDAEAVIDAAKNAGVHEFILTLPQGYDTQIGGPDGTLSPGQRQRIALARALYRLPKLVILDEPNSNLDDAGEQALSDAIEVLKEAQSTVVVVSHRQRVLPLADVFIVMAHGVVTDYGPSQDVIARVTQNKSNTSHKELPPLASEKQASVAGTTVSGSASKKLRPFNSQTPEKD